MTAGHNALDNQFNTGDHVADMTKHKVTLRLLLEINATRGRLSKALVEVADEAPTKTANALQVALWNS
jgi:hypothetical protein